VFFRIASSLFFGAGMKRAATSSSAGSSRRSKPGVVYLFKELQNMERKMEYIVEADDNDICLWTVGVSAGCLKDFGYDPLAKYLILWAQRMRQQPCIVFEIRFPTNYPDSVPFVRVVRPRFQFHTGHVTVGGSICTEMLTPSGWHPMTADALMRSVLATLHEGEARIQFDPDMHCPFPNKDYSFEEAKEAFDRVARDHGWLKKR
jgi:hypothetical protein